MSNLYLDNSNVIELVGLKNSITETADVGATVSTTLLEASGAAVAGETWPLSMPHTASGTYRATMSHEVSISAGHSYTAKITAIGSGGEVGSWSCVVVAQRRACE